MQDEPKVVEPNVPGVMEDPEATEMAEDTIVDEDEELSGPFPRGLEDVNLEEF